MIVFLLCLVIIFLSIIALNGNIDYKGDIKNSFIASTCTVVLTFTSLYVFMILVKALVRYFS